MLRNMKGQVAPLAAICLLQCLSGAPAAAQALAVTPTVIEMPATRSSAAMEVRNPSDRQIAVEMRLYNWRQSEGADVLEEVPGLTVSPPIATIASGAVQTFRILLPKTARVGEQSYRVILDQLPDNQPAASGGLGVRLRMSMPIFAGGSAHDEAKIEWRIAQGSLIAANAGSKRLRFTALTARDGSGSRKLPLGTAPYLLAGTTRSWPLPAGGGSLHLTGMSDAGAIDAIVNPD